jgi:hypothetical protein
LDWRTTGDASESALIKFFQPLRDIEDYRNANPQVPRLLDQALESEITKEQPKKKKKLKNGRCSAFRSIPRTNTSSRSTNRKTRKIHASFC